MTAIRAAIQPCQTGKRVVHGCRECEEKAAEQSGIIEELQQHISHLEHLHEIEAASRKKALATHKVGAHPSMLKGCLCCILCLQA